MKQVDIMRDGEADAWFERNRDQLGLVDRVSETLLECAIRPANALEIGCANGWRLARWHELYGANCIGVEPSIVARRAGNRDAAFIRAGDAAVIPALTEWADVLIYGFCLYLTDPEDWLRIAAEGDRVLARGGYLVVNDFHAPGNVSIRPYEHNTSLVSYHFDFVQLWLAHPRYSVVRRNIYGEHPNEETVVVLRKKA